MEQFEALNARIKAALPLDPASKQAQRFLDERDALLAPFVAAIWLSNSFFPDTGDAVATLEVLLNLTLMFAAVIAGATYLSRAYVAAETALAS